MPVLTTASELADLLAGETPPVVLDVRWKLGGPPGHGEYLRGHIPGAVFVDLDTELASHGEPTDGRHPLPTISDLQDSARRWGVNDGDLVVVYDGEGNLASARAWWLLRWAGVSDVRILDGALPAWSKSGGVLVKDDVTPVPGNVTLTPGSLPSLSVDGVKSFHGVLLDARAPERYRGETEPIDPKAGYIPGAVNAPTGGNLDAEGRFLPAEQLRARFEALGVNGKAPVAAYCGSGVTASHELAALAIAGFDATLYPGSFSQWSNLDLPVETSVLESSKLDGAVA